MPTVKAPTRDTSELDLNAFNITLRSQPWYQAFFKAKGLDPNKVKLSRRDQGDLQSLMASNGMKLPGGMHIDNAGNVNQKNRLARNTAIVAGIAAGGYFAAPAIIGAFSTTAATAGTTAAASSAVPTIASTAFPALAASAGPTIAGAATLGGTAGAAAAAAAGTSLLSSPLASMALELGGSILTSRLSGGRGAPATPTSTRPSMPETTGGVPLPPSTARDWSTAQYTGQIAATRTRRRVSAPGLGGPVSLLGTPAARLQPRTLIGA